ncbi:hypothetical protein Nepgr_011592 [Nepenthes gracilis]|uniref:Secreted protein n=1 Tax=Nepenthes gracilis TaxID=150966 RepID=A0AAD3XMI6_NEPGR|nr:hypothetical protein Nepgr_011592 [Nepenthes gracilis]
MGVFGIKAILFLFLPPTAFALDVFGCLCKHMFRSEVLLSISMWKDANFFVLKLANTSSLLACESLVERQYSFFAIFRNAGIKCCRPRRCSVQKVALDFGGASLLGLNSLVVSLGLGGVSQSDDLDLRAKGKHALPGSLADRIPGKQQGDGARNSLLIPAGTAHGSSTSHPDSEAKLCVTTTLNTVGYASPHNQLGRPCIRTRCISTLITSIQWAQGTKTLAQH